MFESLALRLVIRSSVSLDYDAKRFD